MEELPNEMSQTSKVSEVPETSEKTAAKERLEKQKQWEEENPYDDMPMEIRSTPEAGVEYLNEEIKRFKEDYPLEKLHAISVLSPRLNELFAQNLTKRNAGETEVEQSKREKLEKNDRINALLVISTSEDVELYKLRAGAIEALKPIVLALNTLKEKTTIDPAELKRLKLTYLELSNAVGKTNNLSNKKNATRWVDHY